MGQFEGYGLQMEGTVFSPEGEFFETAPSPSGKTAILALAQTGWKLRNPFGMTTFRKVLIENKDFTVVPLSITPFGGGL